MRLYKSLHLCLFWISSVFFLSACMTSNTLDATSTVAQATIPPTLTMAPSATQTSMPTITDTTTATSQPTVTASPTETPTLTPLPTLPADEAMDLVVELLNTNAGCQLPCYWGFTPGTTSWDEAGQFLESIVDYYSTYAMSKDTIIGEISFPVPEEIDPYMYLPQAYTVRNNIIEQIEIRAGIVPSYTLSAFLNTYGPPDEIWTNPDGELILSTYLFYPQQGILAVYTHRNASLTNTNIEICPQNEANPLLILWSPGVKKSFLDDVLNHTALLTHITELSLFHKVEEVTDMDVETFYDTYSDPDTEICFHIPREKWPDLRTAP